VDKALRLSRFTRKTGTVLAISYWLRRLG